MKLANWKNLIILLGNFWWWEAFKLNRGLGLMMLGVGVLAVVGFRKRINALILMAVVNATIMQFTTTNRVSLFKISNDDRRLIDLRLAAYPPITWAPIAYYFEAKPVSYAFNRYLNNLFENLDLNQYFYAFHPRERVGVIEVEKLPFIFLPFAVYGLGILWRKRPFVMVITAVALATLAPFGNISPLGAVATYPLWLIAIDQALWQKK